MQREPKPQGGKTLIIILALVVAGVGAAIYQNETRRTAQQQAAQREADQAKANEEAQRKANESRAAQEREAMQKAAEAAKSNDILANALKAADEVYVRWQDAATIASSTSRMALSTSIASLQVVKRDAAALTVPPCLSAGKTELLKGMELTVEGYLEFLANTAKLGSVMALSKFEAAKPHFDNYLADRKLCPSP